MYSFILVEVQCFTALFKVIFARDTNGQMAYQLVEFVSKVLLHARKHLILYSHLFRKPAKSSHTVFYVITNM